MDVRPLQEDEIATVHDELWMPFAREMAALDDHDALVDDEERVRKANVAYRRERFADDDAHTLVAVPSDADRAAARENERVASRLSRAGSGVSRRKPGPLAFAGYVAAEISESPPVFARGDALYVADLYVRPAFRGDGLAGDLLDAVESWGAERGCERAELHVNARNDRARDVYESRDYEVFQHKLRRSL
jgi:GNAT superfamily N-acetyltransferase